MVASKKKNHKTKKDKHITIKFNSTVLQFIRQHARSSPNMEICGVLIGQKNDKQTIVEGAIAGKDVLQGGAHVTFTQETWNHIHNEKDKKYPDRSIVGWYHSHPGFGVFLSEHDIFIHNNFFSDPGHIAWIFDPNSDEEGCFGWINREVNRINQFEIITDFDDVEHKKSLRLDIPSQTSKFPALRKRFFYKQWIIPFLFVLNGMFLIMIIILFLALKAQNTKISNNNNAIKNEVDVMRSNTPSLSNNGESLSQEEKADTIENIEQK